MTPALLLAAMLGVAPVDTTYHLDWKEWTRPDGSHCTAGTSGGPFDDEICISLRTIRPDTIEYWLSRRMDVCGMALCEVVDTVWVMRKR